ncbi:hypothetical protein AVEN_167647-1 [Araneus ventricosus]|uniref:Uncharacterized protein n=1 Tax=Araneus ventricosus TaxID=182803 RepID=A0A4Y2J879_ARAVE|nr:hypothetical protein AVEN_167647-1 [Araneus ventricosus]
MNIYLVTISKIVMSLKSGRKKLRHVPVFWIIYLYSSKCSPLATVHIYILDWISRCTLCNMAGVTEAQASVMRRLRSCNVGGGVAYTCPFMCPHKKSNGVESGELGATLRNHHIR